MKAFLTVFVLAAAMGPGLAVAQGCDHEQKIKISCADGTSWDDQSKTCAPTVGS